MAAAIAATIGAPQYGEEIGRPGGGAGAANDDAPPTIVTTVPQAPPPPQEQPTGFDTRVCVFLTLHHPAFSPLAKALAAAMGATILVSCFGFALGTTDYFQYRPSNCAYPVCVPGPNSLCTQVVCKPVQTRPLQVVESVTVAIFSIELLLRLITVHAVPQRCVLIQYESFINGNSVVGRSVYFLMRECSYINISLYIYTKCAQQTHPTPGLHRRDPGA